MKQTTLNVKTKQNKKNTRDDMKANFKKLKIFKMR